MWTNRRGNYQTISSDGGDGQEDSSMVLVMRTTSSSSVIAAAWVGPCLLLMVLSTSCLLWMGQHLTLQEEVGEDGGEGVLLSSSLSSTTSLGEGEGLLLSSSLRSTATIIGKNGKNNLDMLGVAREEELPHDLPADVVERCEYVVNLFETNNHGKPHDILVETYAKQSVDYNVFYRATAQLFWQDFAQLDWDSGILRTLNVDLFAGSKLQDKTTWTWVTGDQHLSNFGAWRNRNNNVVFGLNDFDEAAIYDFHVDVIRLAVSIYNHAVSNKFSDKKIKKLLRAFTDEYVDTVVGYVGNEDALDFELTSKTAKGVLKKFLMGVENDNSHSDQVEKYTNFTGAFVLNKKTRLVPVDDGTKTIIRRAFTSRQYGATMVKTGWHVHRWDDDYFKVLDVARRTGSGVGSYGVDRYYVLLNGENGKHILLDVKYEPRPAVSYVLDEDDKAWYENLFRNEAARAVEAQRRLTSYVDPFTGWILVNGNAFVVREKSPWKDELNLDKITDYDDFETFIRMVGVATATSHTRGTQGKTPGEFKQVIAEVLGPKKKDWAKAVFQVASLYHEQVLLDYKCFKQFVDENYPSDESE